MKKKLLIITAIITAISAVTSLYLTGYTNPTDIQQFFFITTSVLAFVGAIAIFLLLDNDNDQDDPSAS